MAIAISTFPVEQHVFDMILYPQQHPNNSTWVHQNLHNVNVQLTQAGTEHMLHLQQMNRKLNDESNLRNARNAIKDIQTSLKPNIILPLLSPDNLEHATPVMQRYIMACPEVRQPYQQGRLDWYNESYVDEEEGKIGEDHYDYRMAVSGVVQDDASYLISLEDIREGDRELTPREQADISVTWEYVKKSIEENYDPFKRYRNQ